MQIKLETVLIAAASLGVVLVGAYIAKKGLAGAAAGVVGAAGDVAAGTVVGIGELIGIPATSETECEKALREGRTWDASFACPAGRFLQWTFGGVAESERGGASGSW